MLRKIILLSAFICSSVQVNAQCTAPLSSINENFQNFQQTSLPQNCWTASTPQTNVTDWFGDGDLAVFLLTGPGAQTPSYLVSPMVTFGQERTISFNTIGAGKMQVGTLTSAADFSTFVPLETFQLFGSGMQYHILMPVSSTARYIAFKLIPQTTTSHLVIDDIAWPSPLGCETAISTFNEDFATFENGDVSQKCWAASYDETYLAISGADTHFVVFTCEHSENITALYLVTPRITDLTGNHTLSFRATGADGQFQPGTMASSYDFNSFTPSGPSVLVTPGLHDYNVPLSGPAAHHYAALKFTVAPGFESSIALMRKIALDQPLSSEDFEKTAIGIYPNPVKSVLNITGHDVRDAVIYDLHGRIVLNINAPSVDVSGLGAGVYVLKAQTQEGTVNQKFIKQ